MQPFYPCKGLSVCYLYYYHTSVGHKNITMPYVGCWTRCTCGRLGFRLHKNFAVYITVFAPAWYMCRSCCLVPAYIGFKNIRHISQRQIIAWRFITGGDVLPWVMYYRGFTPPSIMYHPSGVRLPDAIGNRVLEGRHIIDGVCKPPAERTINLFFNF